MSRQPTFLSLFSGCGGLDLGFHRAGFRCIGAAECDQWAIQTYAQNLGTMPARIDLARAMPHVSSRVDVVVAGPPCQGFSTVGLRAHDDPRNDLFIVPVRAAIDVAAECLVIENVPGILTGSGRARLTHALDLLKHNGYKARLELIDAASARLPQRRRRMVLLARRRVALPPLELPTPPAEPLSAVLPIAPGLANHEPRPLAPKSRAGLIAQHIRSGEKLCNVRAASTAVHSWNIPEVFGRTSAAEREFLDRLVHLRRQNRRRSYGDADPVLPSVLRSEFGPGWKRLAERLVTRGYLRVVEGGLYDLTHTFNGKFKRLRFDRPTNCVLTKFCQPEYFLHPHEDRPFTIREAARVQGFPDDFVFLGPFRSQAKQVGNAVPPPLAAQVASWLRSECF